MIDAEEFDEKTPQKDGEKSTKNGLKKKNHQEKEKYLQSTLDNFTKQIRPKKEACVDAEINELNAATISSLTDVIKPKVLDFSKYLDYESFMEALEVLEFAQIMSFVLCPSKFSSFENLNYEYFIKSLEGKKDFAQSLFIVLQIFIFSIIKLEDISKKRKNKSARYIQIWKKNIVFLKNETLPEFLRSYINYACSRQERDEKSLYRLRYQGDFYEFDYRDKLKVINLLVSEIQCHLCYNKLFDHLEGVKLKLKDGFTSKSSECQPKKRKNSECLSSHICSEVFPDVSTNEEEYTFLESNPFLGTEHVSDEKATTKICRIEYFWRKLPLFIKDQVYIWNFETVPFLLVEDFKNKKLGFYDHTFIPTMKEFSESLKAPSFTLMSYISALESMQNKQEEMPESDYDHNDVVENVKKLFCKIIQNSITDPTTYAYFKNKLMISHKYSPRGVKPWASFFSDFVYRTWEALRKLNMDLPSAPAANGTSLNNYISKSTSWSGLFLSGLIVEKTLSSVKNIRRILNSVNYHEANLEELTNKEQEEKTKLYCSDCRKPIEQAAQINFQSSDQNLVCRSCRYERRKKTTDSTKKVSKTKEPENKKTKMVNRNEENDDCIIISRKKNRHRRSIISSDDE